MDKTEERKARREKRRFPILAKTIIMIYAFSLVLSEIAMTYFAVVMSTSNKRNYTQNADSLAATVATVVNPDDFLTIKNLVATKVNASPTHPITDECTEKEYETYIAPFQEIENDETFKRVREYLRKLQTANANVDCIYLSYVDANRKLFVYVCDAATEEACTPGTLDKLYDENQKVLTDPSVGFPAYITKTDAYGWLVTSGAPVKKDNKVIGYAMVDFSMVAIRERQAKQIVRLFVYLMISSVLISAVGVLIIHQILIKPIQKIKETTDSYSIDRPEETHEKFKNLNVKVHDELKDLSLSVKKMENDLYEKLHELSNKNTELSQSREKVANLTELANKDGLTSVRNKIAFNQTCAIMDKAIANKKSEKFGIAMVDLNFLKNINDEFGHAVGDTAIIKLSNIICAIFLHSAVYRVGGDEFVVILKDADYRHSQHLVNQFQKKIANLIEDKYLSTAERVSAAIGYAEFDPVLDTSVSNVLERADRIMYENKHAMKDKYGSPFEK